MILTKLIGLYFLVEGIANVLYWYGYGNGVKDNDFWQLGRVLRSALGVALVILG